ncbi:MAG: ArsB/NhaD family transporter [Chloroflexi bacterium]|nr:ArsB/NhaD family transporter [Chloroflexota bacterium]
MLDFVQILALIIFLAVFVVIVVGKIHRFIPASIGAVLILLVVLLGVMRSPQAVLNVLNLSELGSIRFWVPGHEQVQSHGINWQTVIFIGGMMVMVEGLGAAGFFRWLCLYLARLVKYKLIPLFLTFMLLSGFLSMFIDSITVLLFLASVTIELARTLKFDPVPFIIAEIFAANVGGAATMAGDPPNIIIGTAFGYTFTDFMVNTGPVAWAGMVLALVFFYLCFRGSLSRSEKARIELRGAYPEPKEAITNSGLFKVNIVIFVLAILLLITHAQTGISVALIGVIAAALTLLAARSGSSHLLKRLDWRTLLFFIGLFVIVGGLEETGVLKTLAEGIGNISGGNLFWVTSIILWVSAFASAIVDNIPFAATMVPILSSLSQSAGLSLPIMSWFLALGTDIGGNATPIGASANVVGTAISDREGYPISWGRFLKYAAPAMIMVLVLIHVLLIVRYF